MFRTSVVRLQDRSYAVCCNLVCLDTSCCYEGEGRTAQQCLYVPSNTTQIQYNHLMTLEICYTFRYRPKHVAYIVIN